MTQTVTKVTPIRSGESAPQASLAVLKDKSAKTYHHMVPGARFIMPDGLEVQFLGGQYVTTDPEIIAQLDAIANRPASMVYTKKEAVEAVLALSAKAAAEAVQIPAKAE